MIALRSAVRRLLLLGLVVVGLTYAGLAFTGLAFTGLAFTGLRASAAEPSPPVSGEPPTGPAAEPPAMPTGEPAALIVDHIQTMRYRLGEVIVALPDLPYAGLYLFDRLTKDGDRRQIGTLAAGLAAVLLCASMAEFGFRRLFRAIRHEDEPAPRDDFGRLARLSAIALVDGLALAVWAMTGLLAYFVLHPDESLVREAFTCVLLSIVAVRGTLVPARMLLAPSRPDLRIPRLDDADARGLLRWTALLLAFCAALVVCGTLLWSVGLPDPIVLAAGTVLQWAGIAAIVALVSGQRRRIALLVSGGPSPASRRHAGFLADHWHVLFGVAQVALGIFGTVSRLLTGESQGAHILGTLAILLVALVLDGLLRMAVQWLVPPVDGPAASTASGGGSAPRTERTDLQFAPVILRNLRIMLGILGLMALGRLWDVDLEDFVAGGLGVRIAHAMFDIVLTLILASAVWGVIRTAIDRHAPHAEIDAHALAEGEVSGTGLTRLETLLPLLRKFVLIVLVSIVAMIVVSSLGVDIGPLLAGAGVVGIAVGFGAQTLVRDIFSGVFFLIDDAFRVGEYIDVGTAKGTVERISIRSLRLRHHLGQINTIPFGEIRHVTNYSRDWVIMKLELRVPYDTDLEKVRKLVKRLGQELLGHPEHGENFLQPLKSQGVHRMDDDAFIVRVKFMAKPGEQFILRREVYRRLQEVFQENGIKFAPRRVIVDGPPEAVGAAAATVIGGEASAAGRT